MRKGKLVGGMGEPGSETVPSPQPGLTESRLTGNEAVERREHE